MLVDLQERSSPGGDAYPDQCLNCAIRRSGFCEALNGRDITSLARVSHHRSFKPGQTVMRYDEPPIYWSAVSSGILKLTKLIADGRQQIVGLLFPGDFVGRLFSTQSPYFVEAVTDAELCCIRVGDFEAMLENRPAMKQSLFEHTLAKLDTAQDWLVVLGRKTAEERVASLLHLMVTRAPIAAACANPMDRAPRFEISMKREEMATFLGLTYETVIRQLKSLDEAGIITRMGRRHFQVPDLDALRQAAG